MYMEYIQLYAYYLLYNIIYIYIFFKSNIYMMSNVIVCLQEEHATGFNHELIFDSGSPPAFRCFFFTAGMDGGLDL